LKQQGVQPLGLLRIVALINLVVILAACSTLQGAEITQPTKDPANAGLVARVNSIGITEAEYQRELERRRAVSNVASPAVLERDVLETLIRQQVIKQSAPGLGVEVSEDDVRTEFENLRSMSSSEADWEQFLAMNNYTQDEMYAAQRDALITQRVQSILVNDYLQPIEQVNARHIVVATREEAESLLERLNKGEDFGTLAANYSLDTTTRQIGGHLDWFARKELFYPNLEDIAFQLEPGQIAGPIPTALGYHIIQTLDKAVRPVEQERLPMISESIFSSWLEKQYQQSAIERYQ
jgi:parvulin-like peptidyl-prolyl isomerase